MSFNLEIVFQGMCTFVPERDGSGLWVLMLDELVPGEKEIPPHESVIRFFLENLVPGTPGTGFRRLEQHDVRISPRGATPFELKGFDAKENKPFKSEPDKDSFFWISPVEEACEKRNLEGRGLIDSRFLRPAARLAIEDANQLSARLFFSEGTVGTKELAGLNGNLVESAFVPPGVPPVETDYRQLTAASVSLNTVIDSDSVTFETTKLRTGEISRSLTLRPSGAGQSVTVFIMNEEAESLIGLAQPPVIELGIVRPQDKIFRLMYSLCTNPPALDQRPMPIPNKLIPRTTEADRGIILDGAPPCSPSRGVLPVIG